MQMQMNMMWIDCVANSANAKALGVEQWTKPDTLAGNQTQASRAPNRNCLAKQP